MVPAALWAWVAWGGWLCYCVAARHWHAHALTVWRGGNSSALPGVLNGVHILQINIARHKGVICVRAASE